MKILLTGSSGFIGKNIYKHLKNVGHDVVCIDKHNCDLADRNNLSYLVDQLAGCDLVIHCAGHADVRNSHIELDEQFDDNVISTKTVLDAMTKTDVKDIIYLSSAVANCSYNTYLNTQTLLWDVDYTIEDDVNVPQSIYGTMKSMSEKMIEGYTREFNFRSIIMRLENIAGPHYCHGIVLDFINKLTEHPEYLDVLGNGNQTKAYLHTTDLTKIIDSLYRVLICSDYGRMSIYNVGNTDMIQVKEIAKIVCDKMKLNPNIIYGCTEKGFNGDIPCIAMSKHKLLSHCKKPCLSSRETIEKTTEWILSDRKRN